MYKPHTLTAVGDSFLIYKSSISEDSWRLFCFSIILFNQAMN